MARIDFTERYYIDSYARELEATVLSCEETGDGNYHLTFDETIFYPEGGGQPGDRGQVERLESSERVDILDTQYDTENRIVHLATGPLSVGERVQLRIDWERRYEFMQQHSAEHLVSGLIKQRYGFENVGFHINEELTTLDTSGELPEGAIAWLTEAMNEVVWGDLPFETTVHPAADVAELDYRSKIDLPYDVRLVRVEGVDLCACAGTHVHQTGELGQVRFIDHHKHRGGTRLTMLAGSRALRDAERLQAQALRMGARLAAPRLELEPALDKLDEQMEALVEENRRLTARLFGLVFPGQLEKPTVAIIPEGLSGKDIKYQMKGLELAEGGKVLFLQAGQTGVKFFLRCTTKEEQQEVMAYLKEAHGAKGGGPPQLSQGALASTDVEAVQADFAEQGWARVEV